MELTIISRLTQAIRSKDLRFRGPQSIKGAAASNMRWIKTKLVRIAILPPMVCATNTNEQGLIRTKEDPVAHKVTRGRVVGSWVNRFNQEATFICRTMLTVCLTKGRSTSR